jgi:hypothetical protein
VNISAGRFDVGAVDSGAPLRLPLAAEWALHAAKIAGLEIGEIVGADGAARLVTPGARAQVKPL